MSVDVFTGKCLMGTRKSLASNIKNRVFTFSYRGKNILPNGIRLLLGPNEQCFSEIFIFQSSGHSVSEW